MINKLVNSQLQTDSRLRSWLVPHKITLVVLWLAFAVMGGAVFLPQHTGVDVDRKAESSQEVGLGFCAATAAVLFVAIARRPRRQTLSAACPSQTSTSRAGKRPAGGSAPRPPSVPLRRTLQVFLI